MYILGVLYVILIVILAVVSSDDFDIVIIYYVVFAVYAFAGIVMMYRKYKGEPDSLKVLISATIGGINGIVEATEWSDYSVLVGRCIDSIFYVPMICATFPRIDENENFRWNWRDHENLEVESV